MPIFHTLDKPFTSTVSTDIPLYSPFKGSEGGGGRGGIVKSPLGPSLASTYACLCPGVLITFSFCLILWFDYILSNIIITSCYYLRKY